MSKSQNADNLNVCYTVIKLTGFLLQVPLRRHLRRISLFWSRKKALLFDVNLYDHSLLCVKLTFPYLFTEPCSNNDWTERPYLTKTATSMFSCLPPSHPASPGRGTHTVRQVLSCLWPSHSLCRLPLRAPGCHDLSEPGWDLQERRPQTEICPPRKEVKSNVYHSH